MTRSRSSGFGAGYVYGIAGGIRDGAGQAAVGSEHECRPQSLVHLHPVMAQALAEAGLGMDQMDGIAVGVGPGSYTGIRIAVTAAKTLAWANRIPLVGVSSLHALAWGLKSGWNEAEPKAGVHWIIPLLDARRGRCTRHYSLPIQRVRRVRRYVWRQTVFA